MKPRCDRCKFWYMRYKHEKNEHRDDRYGECHRHAPRPSEEISHNIGRALGAIRWAVEITANVEQENEDDYEFGGVDQYQVSQWPQTRGPEWCGDFVRKKK